MTKLKTYKINWHKLFKNYNNKRSKIIKKNSKIKGKSKSKGKSKNKSKSKSNSKNKKLYLRCL